MHNQASEMLMETEDAALHGREQDKSEHMHPHACDDVNGHKNHKIGQELTELYAHYRIGITSHSRAKMNHALAIQLFGKPTFWQKGKEISFAYEKARSTLIYLIGEHGKMVPREHLSVLLWPDKGPVMSRQNLRQALMSCRRQLGKELDSLISSSRSSAMFTGTDNVWCDAIEFDRLFVAAATAAENKDNQQELSCLIDCLSLVTGEYAAQMPSDLPGKYLRSLESKRTYYKNVVAMIHLRLRELGVESESMMAESGN